MDRPESMGDWVQPLQPRFERTDPRLTQLVRFVQNQQIRIGNLLRADLDVLDVLLDMLSIDHRHYPVEPEGGAQLRPLKGLHHRTRVGEPRSLDHNVVKELPLTREPLENGNEITLN